MTATRETVLPARDDATRDRTLVWIDAREAVIARWQMGEVRLERLRSDVPSHHRATGHVRYDPAVRHGGGAPQDAGEQRRLEHLARFVELVATHVPPDDDLVILGPGTVRDRLEHVVRETDEHASRTRSVTCRAAARLTDHQLVARLRHVAGADPRRWTGGTYRQTETPSRRPSGSVRPTPRRAGPKPMIEIDEEDLIEEEPG
jgi:hypothetical protein